MTEEEFWQSYKEIDYGLGLGPCWIWTKARRGKYGAALMNGKVQDVHRISYKLTHGVIPDGLWILHKCDHGLCFRPEHIWAGTAAENIHDMDAKGRANRPSFKGEEHGMAKLTEADVLAIRARYPGKRGTVKALAEEYGVNRMTIFRVTNEKNWTHVA